MALDTIRWRIILGLSGLLAGLVVAALVGVTALTTLRSSLALEIERLRASSEIGNGLVTAVFDEIRAAEQARAEFPSAADTAFSYQKRLDGLFGLSEAERITVNRIKQLQSVIHVDYSLAHAELDVGHSRDAQTLMLGLRAPAAELTRLMRDLSARQSDKAAAAGQRLAALARQRQIVLWLVLIATAIVGVMVGVFTLRWVEGPLLRLVTAAERFGSGDLRPVTTGQMPREFEVLADAIQQMGNRLRQIVGDVIGESDRIAGAAGDLSAVSEELAASSSEVSTAMVEISGGADQQRAALTAMGTGLVALRAATGDMADAAERAAKLGEEIRTVADRHRGDVAAAGSVLLNVREVVQTTSKQISQLGELSTSIDDFVDLIKRISS